jgi:hypothetical protein
VRVFLNFFPLCTAKQIEKKKKKMEELTEYPEPTVEFASVFDSVFSTLFNDEQHFQDTNKLEMIYLNQRHSADKKTKLTDKQLLSDLIKSTSTLCHCKEHVHNAWRMMPKYAPVSKKYVPLVYLEADTNVTNCSDLNGYCISCFTDVVSKTATLNNETRKVSFICPGCRTQLSTEMFYKQTYVVNIGKRGRPKSTDKKTNLSPPELIGSTPPPIDYVDKKPSFHRGRPIFGSV